MRIDEFKQTAALPRQIKEEQSSFPKADRFGQQMLQAGRFDYAEHISQLREKVEEQGLIVAKRVCLSELDKYRRLVGELLAETSSQAFSYLKKDQFDFYGRHKTFALIKKVNDKLAELAREVLNEQADNIRLLQMADDIRGLLVDIFL